MSHLEPVHDNGCNDIETNPQCEIYFTSRSKINQNINRKGSINKKLINISMRLIIRDNMSSKEEFKNFAYKHPELVRYIKNGEATWQKFYEIYDIYGENLEAWKDYIGTSSKTNTEYNLKSLTDKLKNLDLNTIQEHISTAQKALGIVQELTGKSATTGAATAEVINPRPINKIFED